MLQKNNEAGKKIEKVILVRERYKLLSRIQNSLELPMIILGFAWLILLIIEFIWGLGHALQTAVNIIWIIFIIDFVLKFILAPHKINFLKKNILTAISLVIPALRMFRILRALRAVRGLRLVKVVSSLNRGMRSVGRTMHRRAFGYVFTITVIVIFTGAAGIFAFEKDADPGFKNYGEALWWTAMLLTSLGSEYWPKTPEGRALCFLLSLYGFAVLGYFTATLASVFIGQDASDKKADIAGASQVKALHNEIKLLRQEIQNFKPQ